MTVTVHQAVYGDMKGAHGRLASSPNAPETQLDELLDYTDRLLPAETLLNAYICGFPLGEFYVLTRTFPSPQASRAGMVQTHALLIKKDACEDVDSLSDLIALLPNQPTPPEATLQTLTVHAKTLPERSDIPPGYLAVIHRLVTGEIPVWMGHEGFEEVVCCLWRHLWKEARQALKFRVSAGPEDIDEVSATLVYTLPALRLSWGTRSFVDKTTPAPSSLSKSEACLSGAADGDQLRELQKRLGLPLTSIDSLKKLERYHELLTADTAASLRTAARLLSKVAPLQAQAETEKRLLLERLLQKTKAAGEEDILALRNLDLDAFSEGVVALQRSVGEYIQDCLVKREGGADIARETFLVEHPWKNIARQSILAAFQPWRDEYSGLIWNWCKVEPGLVLWLKQVVPNSEKGEADLIAALPSELDQNLEEAVLGLSRERSWHKLHAHILAISRLPALQKFHQHIATDLEPESIQGLKILSDATGGQAVLEAALSTEDDRLLCLAGEAAVKEPVLLKELDPKRPAWRAIWTYSWELGGEQIAALTVSATTISALMDALLAHEEIPTKLLELIAPHANLVGYARQVEIWEALPKTLAGQSKVMTATSWLQTFLENPGFDSHLEPELETYVLTEWRRNPTLSQENALRLWRRFPELDENDLLRWLRNLSLSRFSPTGAMSLGLLIRERKWSKAATQVLREVRRGRSDLQLAIQECVELLGFLDKAKFALLTNKANFTSEDWWQAWLQLTLELYPKGTDDNDIWASAAGDRARIKGDTGQEQWRSGLKRLREGGAGKDITVEGLLHQMRKDFPLNEDLEVIESLYKKNFSRR